MKEYAASIGGTKGEWYGMNGMALTLIIRAFYLPKDSNPFSFYCVNKRSIS